ncbi:alpha/beta fold hydrolase [Flavisphingopyxis soli]|uniref:alpha/beta fold hydrolase n=1 Tax=Flavisphingopyxis soli TaxID=2601267 RepID=UPI001F34DFDE|nr:alpha/beta hydrolase [Sphingorhabdus soli]
MTELSFLDRPGGARLAFRHLDGTAPTLVFLPGYMSDMDGGKAGAVFAWAQREGRACLLLDYAGCGSSGGQFADQTLDDWRDDVAFLIEQLVDGPVILVGSSMGGWLMLLVAFRLGARVVGLVGIAAAPDFTDWGFSDADKATIRTAGRLEESTPYSDDPYVTTRGFFDSGEANRVLGDTIAIDCPVRLLHGQRDADVPWDVSLQLADRLRSDDVQVVLVKDGDHRLSRERDVALLLATLARLVAPIEGPTL